MSAAANPTAIFLKFIGPLPDRYFYVAGRGPNCTEDLVRAEGFDVGGDFGDDGVAAHLGYACLLDVKVVAFGSFGELFPNAKREHEPDERERGHEGRPEVPAMLG